MTVVEEVFEVAHHLTSGSALQQLREWVLVGVIVETLGQGREIDLPHVDAQVVGARCEEQLAVDCAADAGYFRRVSNQSHCVVRVALQWQLDDTYNLVLGRIGHVLILVVVLLVCGVEHQ